MATDLISRCRDHWEHSEVLCLEAADEIERLTRQLDDVRRYHENAVRRQAELILELAKARDDTLEEAAAAVHDEWRQFSRLDCAHVCAVIRSLKGGKS